MLVCSTSFEFLKPQRPLPVEIPFICGGPDLLHTHPERPDDSWLIGTIRALTTL